ncbi:MAG TPA: hypothetical protein DEZ08_01730 [Dehalococcoidia bacterium]|nr:hypothetical protein [Dehalococcoidia bacterium]
MKKFILDNLFMKKSYIHILIAVALGIIIATIGYDRIYDYFAWNAAPNIDQPYGMDMQWDVIIVFMIASTFFTFPIGFGVGLAVSSFLAKVIWFIEGKIIDHKSDKTVQTKSWFTKDND